MTSLVISLLTFLFLGQSFWLFVWFAWRNAFGATIEFASGEHNTPLAGLALDANIRTDTGDFPDPATARVLLAHTHEVSDLYIG